MRKLEMVQFQLSQDERNDGLPGAGIVLKPLLIVPVDDNGYRLDERLFDVVVNCWTVEAPVVMIGPGSYGADGEEGEGEGG